MFYFCKNFKAFYLYVLFIMRLIDELLTKLLLMFRETVCLLTNSKSQFNDRKYIRITMKSKLEGTVNYLLFIDSVFDYAKQNEEP